MPPLAPDEYDGTIAEKTVLAGQYEVIRKLGEGGMGEVHLAKDHHLNNRLVAIKILPALRVASKRAMKQLRQEAAAMAELTHEHIVRFFHFGEHERMPFMVIQYIEGETLDDVLQEKKTFEPDELLELMMPIASALDYAHRKNIIHRDIKPSNIFIDETGKPFLADFGIARIAKDTITQVTGNDTAAGTLQYMSPEQCRGEWNLTPASDIYSFATVLYECLSGGVPFRTGPIRDLIINEPPPPLEIDHPLATIIMKGLSKERDQRPHRAARLCRVTSPSDMSTARNTRTVCFPDSCSLGKIFIMPGDGSDIQEFTIGHTGGPIQVPHDSSVRLNIASGRRSQLHYLNQLDPEVIDELELVDDFYEDEDLPYVSHLTGLKALTILGPRITDSGLLHLQPLAALRRLHLAVEDVTDSGLLSLLRSLHHLSELHLDAPIKTDHLLVSLASINHLSHYLTSLSIHGGKNVSANGLRALSNLCNLHDLSLFDVPLTDDALREILSSNVCIERICLGDVLLTDESVKTLISRDRLQSVIAHGVFSEAAIQVLEDGRPDFVLHVSARKNTDAQPVIVSQTGNVRDADALAPTSEYTHGEQFTNSIGMEFVLINPPEVAPDGFRMGSPKGEKDRDEDEHQHRVVLTSPYWLGVTQVTQSQYRALMGKNPSGFRTKVGGVLGFGGHEFDLVDHPVETVSWNDALEFVERLSERDGQRYRLPSEAEWEFACRAGSTSRFYFGDADGRLRDYAWYHKSSGWRTHPVGKLKPNAWGLYDMHGNVWEWCKDVWHRSYNHAPTDDSARTGGGEIQRRVLRGGSWDFDPRHCRSASRHRITPDVSHNNFGFRVCLDSN